MKDTHVYIPTTTHKHSLPTSTYIFLQPQMYIYTKADPALSLFIVVLGGDSLSRGRLPVSVKIVGVFMLAERLEGGKFSLLLFRKVEFYIYYFYFFIQQWSIYKKKYMIKVNLHCVWLREAANIDLFSFINLSNKMR